MANYLAYGYSAHEIEVKNHIIRRVFFAISLHSSPDWLAWYSFSQSPPPGGDYVVEFNSAIIADSNRKIGSLMQDTAGQLVVFPKINVNEFANTTTVGRIRSSPGNCMIR